MLSRESRGGNIVQVELGQRRLRGEKIIIIKIKIKART